MYPAAFMSWLIGMSQKITSVNRPNLLQIEGEEMQFEKQIWIIGSFIWDFVEVLLQHWQSLCIDLWLEATKDYFGSIKVKLLLLLNHTSTPVFRGWLRNYIHMYVVQNQTKPNKTRQNLTKPNKPKTKQNKTKFLSWVSKPNQIKPNQTELKQTKLNCRLGQPNQINLNQIKPSQAKLNCCLGQLDQTNKNWT